MASSTTARRKLFMHSAHRTIGVSGGGIELRPYCQLENFSSSPDGPLAVLMHVALAADRQDADARASLASFQQAVERHGDVQHHRVEIATIDAGLEDVTDVDCVVLFRQGLHIARRWSDIDTTPWAAENHEQPNKKSPPIQIEIAPWPRRHPLLEGVGPFESRLETVPSEPVPADATVLLIGRTALEDHPIAWLEPLDHGRAFRTFLGSSEDFAQPDFVRFVLGVLRWIGR